MSFLNPGLLLGGLLIASPILIHLLNRRRFRTVAWAAMDFLLQAQQRNRRRILIEDLILLLLRCLAVILLTLVVARPLLQPGRVVGALAEMRTEHVLILDDSPSMEQRLGARTMFETVRSDLLAFVQGLAAERPGDALTLLTTSDPKRPLLSGHHVTLNTPGEVAGVLESIPLSGVPARYEEVFEDVSALLEDVTRRRAVTVITDARLHDWVQDGSPEPDRGAFPNLRRLAEQVEQMRIIHLSPPPTHNLAVVDLRPDPPGLVQGVEGVFTVRIANTGEADADAVEVTLTPGDAPPLVAIHEHLAPGETVELSFRVTFHEAGPILVTAQVGADDLPADNARAYAAMVPASRRVLLVDGDPGLGGDAAETFYLQRALAPGEATRTGYAVEVVDESLFAGAALGEFDLLAICNPYRLAPERREAVEAWVRDGGGLLLFLGNHTDVEAWNEDPLVPLILQTILGDPREASWHHLRLREDTHPVLRIFAGTGNPFLRRVQFFRWWEATLPGDTPPERPETTAPPLGATERAPQEPDAAGRVLAQLNDEMGSPLLVEYGLGRGRVLVFLTGADAAWSNWPADPSYVITMLESAAYLQEDRSMAHVLRTGETIRMPLPPATLQPHATLIPPGHAGAEGDSLPLHTDASGALSVRVEETTKAGVYRIGVRDHEEREIQIPYAVNIPATESDLRPLTPAMLQRGLGDSRVEVVVGALRWARDDPAGQAELWRTLLFLLLVVLFLEQGLGWFFGWRRS